MNAVQIDALPRPAHLLIVDDDDRIRDLLKRYLVSCGAQVSAAADAESARRLIASFDFDLLIVDVMMPREDGFSLVQSVRKTSNVPILMLTARGLPEERIHGLSLGADDYIAKPFEPEELALRINAVLRRASARAAATEGEARFGPFCFDLGRAELTREGAPVRLTDAETALLALLAARMGGPMSREELAHRTGAGLERSVDVQVTRLRRKIEEDPRNPIWLQTVRGVGYRLAVS